MYSNLQAPLHWAQLLYLFFGWDSSDGNVMFFALISVRFGFSVFGIIHEAQWFTKLGTSTQPTLSAKAFRKIIPLSRWNNHKIWGKCSFPPKLKIKELVKIYSNRTCAPSPHLHLLFSIKAFFFNSGHFQLCRHVLSWFNLKKQHLIENQNLAFFPFIPGNTSKKAVDSLNFRPFLPVPVLSDTLCLCWPLHFSPSGPSLFCFCESHLCQFPGLQFVASVRLQNLHPKHQTNCWSLWAAHPASFASSTSSAKRAVWIENSPEDAVKTLSWKSWHGVQQT